MSDKDFIDDMFSDLDVYYPGSKRKRREPVKAQPVVTSWDQDFFKKTLPNGREIQMYTLGSLAKALNRSVHTLRAWMKEGKFPEAPYRLPSKMGKNGKMNEGRRLYSKATVEATVNIFAEAGLLEDIRVDWSSHRNLGNKVAEVWNKIRTEETNNN